MRKHGWRPIIIQICTVLIVAATLAGTVNISPAVAGTAPHCLNQGVTIKHRLQTYRVRLPNTDYASFVADLGFELNSCGGITLVRAEFCAASTIPAAIAIDLYCILEKNETTVWNPSVSFGFETDFVSVGPSPWYLPGPSGSTWSVGVKGFAQFPDGYVYSDRWPYYGPWQHVTCC